MDEMYKSPWVFFTTDSPGPCRKRNGSWTGTSVPMMRRTFGKSQQKCMEDKKSLKKIKATMENKDNIPRYECGWTQHSKVWMWMDYINYWESICYVFHDFSYLKLLLEIPFSIRAKIFEALFLNVPTRFQSLTCFRFSGLQFIAFSLGLCCSFGSPTGRSRSTLGATQPMAAGHRDGGQWFGPGDDVFPC